MNAFIYLRGEFEEADAGLIPKGVARSVRPPGGALRRGARPATTDWASRGAPREERRRADPSHKSGEPREDRRGEDMAVALERVKLRREKRGREERISSEGRNVERTYGGWRLAVVIDGELVSVNADTMPFFEAVGTLMRLTRGH